MSTKYNTTFPTKKFFVEVFNSNNKMIMKSKKNKKQIKQEFYILHLEDLILKEVLQFGQKEIGDYKSQHFTEHIQQIRKDHIKIK